MSVREQGGAPPGEEARELRDELERAQARLARARQAALEAAGPQWDAATRERAMATEAARRASLEGRLTRALAEVDRTRKGLVTPFGHVRSNPLRAGSLLIGLAAGVAAWLQLGEVVSAGALPAACLGVAAALGISRLLR